MTGRILPYGDRALMLELATLDEVLAVHRELAATVPAGVIDIVPAARTVAVTLDPAQLPLSVARAWLARAAHAIETPRPRLAHNAPDLPPARRVVGNRGLGDADAVVIEVDYSGADLPEVARMLGWSVAEVIAWHSGCHWRVAFCGFSPGFGYLVAEPDDHSTDDYSTDDYISAPGSAAKAGSGGRAGRVRVPRRQSPRTSVPAGSVALADEFSGVYPRQSPGGWQLIGQTDAVLWDASREPPALFTPGRDVRFRPVTRGSRR